MGQKGSGTYKCPVPSLGIHQRRGTEMQPVLKRVEAPMKGSGVSEYGFPEARDITEQG